VPAAYLARRSFVADRSVRAAVQALRIAGRAWKTARAAEKHIATRMFLRGPVKALGVSPA